MIESILLHTKSVSIVNKFYRAEGIIKELSSIIEDKNISENEYQFRFNVVEFEFYKVNVYDLTEEFEENYDTEVLDNLIFMAFLYIEEAEKEFEDRFNGKKINKKLKKVFH